MDIDRSNFWGQLPVMLQTICDSQYVAVDLEMSGINADDKPHPQPTSPKPTLQQEYKRARAAAAMYTILQFGLTCINWDHNKKSYVTKTFNITLHPGVVDSDYFSSCLCKTLNRCISVSDRSRGFLEANGFNFPDLFRRGVPYLSVAEHSSSEVCEFIASGRASPQELHLDVVNLPQASMEFRNDLKEKMSTWRAQLLSGASPSPVRVYSPSGRCHRLNGLQKRIVRQLLQARFPDLTSVSRDGGKYLEILKHDPGLQHPLHGLRARTQTVNKQIGARLLWDAIRGQPFAHRIDPALIVGVDKAKCAQLKTQLEGFENRLRKKNPILIGHNMLYDLCFLRSSFEGDLPETVEDFRAVTRSELPRIVDTKYLFTRGGDEMSPDYSLEECFAEMKEEQLPRVISRPPHNYSEPLRHQAGYDSFMTAIVFLKKSYLLAQTGERLWYIASDDLGEEAPTRIPKPLPAPQLNLLEDCNQDEVAALARWTILEPTKGPPTAPPTPEHESKNPSSRTSGTIPEWGGRFWDKYGNRTRVGPFGLILYMPKTAGEKRKRLGGE